MKTPTEIQEQLDAIRRARKHSKKQLAEFEEMQSAAAKLRDTIAKIGEPDYTDDASIERLAVAKTKLELCEKAIAKREDELAVLAQGEAREVATTAAGFLVTLLYAVLHERAQSMAALLQPFCRTQDLALELAQKTDAFQLSFGKISTFKWRWQNVANAGDLVALVRSFAELEEILAEALKGRANLGKFVEVELTLPPEAITGTAVVA